MSAPPRLLVLRREIPAVDPLRAFAGFARGARSYWEDPGQGLAVAASGVAAAVRERGRDRFAGVASGVAELLGRVEIDDPAGSGDALPLLVGGFGFEGAEARVATDPWQAFPLGELALPERCVILGEGRTVVQVATEAATPDAGARLEEAARRLADAMRADRLPPLDRGVDLDVASRLAGDPGDERAYRERVARALAAIRAGRLAKVVVARALELPLPAPLAVEATLAALRAGSPGCRSFAFERGASCFLGATPERLVRLGAGALELDALAGSAPRGESAAEDDALADALLSSRKERAEHAFVVRALERAVAPFAAAGSVELPEAPSVRRLSTIQHLWTPIRARLAEPAPGRMLELLAGLHPTPAVSGTPPEAARQWLRDHEGLARGGYAGPVGWLDRRGEGEIAVALRSALVTPERALLYAGAGVVADSDPAAELEETRVKMRAVARAIRLERDAASECPPERARG